MGDHMLHQYRDDHTMRGCDTVVHGRKADPAEDDTPFQGRGAGTYYRSFCVRAETC